MASAAIPERAVPAAGVKMPAVRGGMGNHSGAVTGEGKVCASISPRRTDGSTARMEKIFWSAACGLSAAGFPSRISFAISLQVTVQGSCGSSSFPSAPISFLFCSVSACRKKRRAGIQVPRAHPEAVHEIIIRAEGRQFIQRGAANKNSQGNGVGKDFTYP